MYLEMAEWQFFGDNEWVFGVKLRGIIRHKLAEVYFNEELDDPRGGWVWRVAVPHDRGLSPNLQSAIAECERVLGIS